MVELVVCLVWLFGLVAVLFGVYMLAFCVVGIVCVVEFALLLLFGWMIVFVVTRLVGGVIVYWFTDV